MRIISENETPKHVAFGGFGQDVYLCYNCGYNSDQIGKCPRCGTKLRAGFSPRNISATESLSGVHRREE